MGNARYDRDEYRSYASASTLRGDGSRKSAEEVFTNRRLKDSLNPALFEFRESCDSEANPNSRPIIMAVDVTGSMGMIADYIAGKGLGDLMEGILDTSPVADPHLMFMAVGDVMSDSAPLQVSQFEPDIRIAQQLVDIFLEGRGGGNNTESYDLPWYFAAKRTKIDCFDKRGKKGYLFTMGDEMPPNGLTIRDLSRVFGPGLAEQKDYTAAELLEMAKEKYEVFHILVEEGSYARRRPGRVYDQWFSLMGNRVIGLSKHKHISEVVLAVIRVNEGEDPQLVINSYPNCADVINHALFPNFNQRGDQR